MITNLRAMADFYRGPIKHIIDYQTMILLSLNTGMRIGDLLNLQWEDFELDTGRTHIRAKRTG